MNFTDAIILLEGGNKIIVDLKHLYNDGQCWPDIQHLPHWLCTCVCKSQVEATWRRKYDTTPTSAHMYQSLPFIVVVVVHTKVEYSKEDLVWKRVNCDNVACICVGERSMQGATEKMYIDVVWLIPLQLRDTHDAWPSTSSQKGDLSEMVTPAVLGGIDWVVVVKRLLRHATNQD